MNEEISSILAENRRRNEAAATRFDPITGEGSSGEREYSRLWQAWLPVEMVRDNEFARLSDRTAYQLMRCHHDFEYWAARCVTVRDKLSGRDIPFVLNRPQRRVAALLEERRRAGVPLRLIMLKARQWGGSTLIQMYFAWIQCVLRRNWHSLICAHVKDTSATIRGMYSKVLEHYPQELWESTPEGIAPALKPFERSCNTREIAGRGCHVTLATAENQESVRGLDASLAHLSEVAFWKDTPQRSGADFARAICSGIPIAPLTFIAMESTANGVGNYFHSEWLRAVDNRSDKIAVFVPWYEIDIYRLAVDDAERLWESLDDYERRLWTAHGVTLEQINWYHQKRRSMPGDQAMHAEYPTTPIEAFAATGLGVFAPELVDRLRSTCCEPEAVGEVQGESPKGAGALRDVHFVADPRGELKVWHFPVDTVPGEWIHNRYIVAVDVGGRSLKSDFSVIAVIERRVDDVPRVVAQWRGHIDHDLLGWKAAAIARWYHKALLVVESNTLESEWEGDSQYILEAVNRHYHNMYRRKVRDTVTPTLEARVGFHTNRSTKAMAITALIAAVRDSDYEERDLLACNEMDTYERQPGGVYAARSGHHDDILMTRAIALYVCSTMSPPALDPTIRRIGSTPSW